MFLFKFTVIIISYHNVLKLFYNVCSVFTIFWKGLIIKPTCSDLAVVHTTPYFVGLVCCALNVH